MEKQDDGTFNLSKKEIKACAYPKKDVITAILVDGGFYRKRAKYKCGDLSPKERAKELFTFCCHLLEDQRENRYLYRIFYYDCPPISKNILDPIKQKTIDLGKSEEYIWMTEFLNELKHQRKLALRLGRLSENEIAYNLKYEALKNLLGAH